MANLTVTSLCILADGHALVKDVSFHVSPGEIVTLIGPNGAGKSMTLRGTLGLVPATGSVTLDDRMLATLSATERARQIAYLPQTIAMAWPAIVRDVVALGRFSHGAAPGRLSKMDADAVETALADCGLEALAHRTVDSLSGGELARVHCARAFCANTPFLIADEPVASLDPAQAFRIMDLLRHKANKGLGVLVVLHDIALAAHYADRMIMMKDGSVVATGPVDTILSAKSLNYLFGVQATVSGRQIQMKGVARTD